MRKLHILIWSLLLIGLAGLFHCGQPAPQAPTAQKPGARPPYLCVLCVDDRRVDVLDLDQRGKPVKSIPLPSVPGVMRVSPLAANLAITDNSGVIRLLVTDLDHPQKFTLGFAPADIGFISHKLWLLSDVAANQMVAFSIVDDKTLKTVATPPGPACYATKSTNNAEVVYLACTQARQLVEFDIHSQSITHSLALPGTPGEMLLDDINKNYIYMTLPDVGKLIRINLTSFTVDASVDLSPGARYLAADSTFAKLYISMPPTAGAGGGIAVVKLPQFGRVTPDPITDARLTDPGHLLVYDAVLNSPVLYVCNPSSNCVALVDLNSYKVVDTIATGKKPMWLGYLPKQENK